MDIIKNIENDINSFLKEKEWDFNTLENKIKVKNIVEDICDKYEQESHIYSHKSVLPDNGVLNIYIQPKRDAGILKNEIKII